MTDETALDAEIQQIAEEGRKKFSLRDRLQNRPQRTDTITIYTDEPTGDALGGARDRTDRGIVVGRERWGILGEIDALEELAKAHREILKAEETSDEQKEASRAPLAETEAKVVDLRKQAEPLIAKLKETSFVFHLRAIPPVIAKDARRRAKKQLDITGKNIPDARVEEFEDVFETLTLAAMIERYDDTQAGETVTEVTDDDVEALRDLLPDGEYLRLSIAAADLRYRNVIDEKATDDPDF